MTPAEKNILINEILDRLAVDSRMIEELDPVAEVSENDLIELNGGRYATLATLMKVGIDVREISKRFLSRENDDIAQGRIVFLDGTEYGKFVAGIYAGKGGAVDAQGNAEFQSAIIRTSLTVMEYIINQQTIESGDMIFSEGDTIENAYFDAFNPDGTQRWWVDIKPRYDSYVTPFTAGMILVGRVRNLYDAAIPDAPSTSYASFMRVNGPELGTSGNHLNVTVYADDDVEGGQNFPPCALMTVARWGHQTDERFQRLFRLSSQEGTLVRYEGVDHPKISLDNIALFAGKVTKEIADEVPGLHEGEEALIAKKIVGTVIQADPFGTIIAEKVYAGVYDENRVYHNNYWEDSSRRYITEYVTYKGCLWLCGQDGIIGEPPNYGTTKWAFYQGNPTFTIDFEEKQICYTEETIQAFGATLTLTATLYNQDVLDKIPAANIHWRRESYDQHGALRAVSDAAWRPATDRDNKRLLLTAADLDYDGTPIGKISFICTASIDDTAVATVQLNIE